MKIFLDLKKNPQNKSPWNSIPLSCFAIQEIFKRYDDFSYELLFSIKIENLNADLENTIWYQKVENN